MTKIKNSLTRKIGPLPAWAWAIVVFGGIWYYRNRVSSASGTGTGSVAPTPVTPQPGQVLQPGESYYDPNTGTLSTAPGGSDGTTSGGGSTNGGSGGAASTPPDLSGITAAIDGMTAAIIAGEQASAGQGGNPGGSTGVGTAPPSGGGGGRAQPALTAKGAIRAPSGPHRPKTRAGYRIVGLGKGNWEWVPVKRTPKPKAQHGAPPKTTTHAKPGTKTRSRSTATTKANGGGRTTGKVKKPVAPTGKARGGAKANAVVARVFSTKRTTPVVSKPVVRQRPVATATPRPTATRPAARPSAPPARTVRAPAPPAPRRPAARKR